MSGMAGQPGGAGPGVVDLLSTPLALWQVLSAALVAAGVAIAVLAIRRGRPLERTGEVGRAAETQRELRGLLADAEDVGRTLVARLDERSERLEELVARAEAAAVRLETAQAAATPRVIGGRGTAASRPAVDPVTARVFELADQGMTPTEIARVVGQHTGKIELMLALRGAGSGGVGP